MPPPTLVSLAITPDPATCTDEGQVQLTAIGTFDDASTADVTTECYWQLDIADLYTGVATLNAGGTAHAGLVTGLAAGTVTVHALFPSFYVAGSG